MRSRAWGFAQGRLGALTIDPPPVQVACSCLERGHALSQLWSALRYILKAAMADRDMAWEMSREAGRREAGNLEGMRALSARLQVRSPSWGGRGHMWNDEVLQAHTSGQGCIWV